MRHRPLRDLRRRLLKGSAHFPEQDVSRELVAGDRKTAHLSQRASSARQAPSGALLFWTRHIGSYEPSVHRAGLGLIPGRVAYQARSLVQPQLVRALDVADPLRISMAAFPLAAS